MWVYHIAFNTEGVAIGHGHERWHDAAKTFFSILSLTIY